VEDAKAQRTQRRKAEGEFSTELPKGFVPRSVAVVTESMAVRGTITALNWLLNDNHRSFVPPDAEGVARHLQVTTLEARELVAFAKTLLPR